MWNRSKMPVFFYSFSLFFLSAVSYYLSILAAKKWCYKCCTGYDDYVDKKKKKCSSGITGQGQRFQSKYISLFCCCFINTRAKDSTMADSTVWPQLEQCRRRMIVAKRITTLLYCYCVLASLCCCAHNSMILSVIARCRSVHAYS